jgi:NitT/TauT family transport system substrate-binding protein
MRSTLSRRALLSRALAIASVALAVAACGGPASTFTAPDGTVSLKIAEPAHSVGYLPLYVGIAKGVFAEEGLDVSTVTLQGGSAHTNAVLTGSAWGFIGGPEHNAFAQAKGASIKAIANVVDRGNAYFVAPPGVAPGGDLAAFFRGKTIVTSAFGGTPNSITRYLLGRLGLDPTTDVRLIETGDVASMLTIVQSGQAQVAVTSEPVLGQGVNQGIWGEPFYNVPRELGPYAYSTLNVTMDFIRENPATVEKFTRAMRKALAFTNENRAETFEVARAEFPTIDPAILQETLDRSYADSLWEFSGMVTPASLDTALNVVRASGVLSDADRPVRYADVVDMSYMERAGATSG